MHTYIHSGTYYVDGSGCLAMAGELLAHRIKTAKQKDNELTDLIFGTVISSNPLRIKTDNFVLDEDFLILSTMVQDKEISITIDGKTGRAKVFRDLQTGDNVTMLRVSKGQRFFVLERS